MKTKEEQLIVYFNYHNGSLVMKAFHPLSGYDYKFVLMKQTA